MRLSQIPDNVKRLLLATTDDEIDDDDMNELSDEELAFCFYFGCAMWRAYFALRRTGHTPTTQPSVRQPNPWPDETIEQDEPLPARARDKRLASPEFSDCAGWHEANDKLRGDYSTSESRLRARYQDVFERELHFGWQVPDFDTWAKGQHVEATG